jgi:hypothetical protein
MALRSVDAMRRQDLGGPNAGAQPGMLRGGRGFPVCRGTSYGVRLTSDYDPRGWHDHGIDARFREAWAFLPGQDL